MIKINAIPNDVLTPVKSKNESEYVPFTQRLSFGLSSLYKSNLINHPEYGITKITDFGKSINPDDTDYLHDLFVEGWKKEK